VNGGGLAVGMTSLLLGSLVGLAAVGGALDDTTPADGGSGGGGGGGALRPGSVPAQFAALITSAGTVCREFPAPYIAAQLKQESGFSPTAVSPAGAQGIAQFMPGTWTAWGQDGDGDGIKNPFDPADAIPAQAAFDCYLAQEMTRWVTQGKVTGAVRDLVLAGYNGGDGMVLASGGNRSLWPAETQSYVTLINQLAAGFTGAPGGTTTPAPGGTALGQAAIVAAMSQLGVPYSWGGGGLDGPTLGIAQGAQTVGFDCSGLVRYAFYRATGSKLTLPRSAGAQVAAGTPISRNQLQPGDAIGFADAGGIHHIGIYIGDQKMVQAPETGKNVNIANLSDHYWSTQTWYPVRFR